MIPLMAHPISGSTRKLKLSMIFFISLVQIPLAQSQELTQVIRGQVTDLETQAPLPFATIALTTADPPMGVISDDEGKFRMKQVPVGRHNILVSFLGYETQVIPELMVTTGKELVLNIRMKEQVSQLEEVQIKAYTKKDKPLNSMATLSARTFSVEEARRYAGGFDDPGRLVSSFAGVTTENSRDNTIVIRGNSPKGLLWRLEGVEIPNPNHFANMETFGGGGISALSALVMGNSDFYTGAFPAEYGNAVSGVFDIRLRSGNNEKYEHAFQAGAMGIDIASEGPLGVDTRASYLFNYRYSTMGIIKVVFPKEIRDFVPTYQDLSFKFHVPTQKAGVFSVWGLASDDRQSFAPEEDTSLWEMVDDRLDGGMMQQIGAAGLTHRFIFKKNGYLSTSMALSGDRMKYETEMLSPDLSRQDYEFIDAANYKITLTSVYNHKFSARHTSRTGIILDNLHYNTMVKHAPMFGQEMITVADERGSANMYQAFTQSKFNVGSKLVINAGLHGHYFDMNQEFVLEPRLGITYPFGKGQSVSLAYGKHSRIEPLGFYYAGVRGDNGVTYPNKDLKVLKAHHLVLAYDLSINPNLRLKVEPYIQFLYDVPVIPDSSFSTINFGADWFFNEELVNTGTGRNYGIDVTLERFLKDGYYYLLTASLFDSKYTGGDGIERNTRFNTRYVFNVLFGKEWTLGAKQNQVLGVNLRMNFTGGKRTSPIDPVQSDVFKDVVYDYSRLYEETERPITYASAGINYRINKRRHSSIWSIQMMNLFLTKENWGYYYNFKTREVDKVEFAVPVPNISYKIEF